MLCILLVEFRSLRTVFYNLDYYEIPAAATQPDNPIIRGEMRT